jgi:hypothetical protein
VLEFDVQRCTRRCASTDQEFQPGDAFYSVLVAEEGEVVRRDYCQAAWKGAPEDCLGWWKSQMPGANTRKVAWAPNDVMLQYFEQLENEPEKQDIRYVLGLLMIRRRIARLEESETDEQGREVMVVYCPRKEDHLKFAVVDPGPSRVEEIQEELAKLLFAGAD